ncbi:MAG: riboflavin synthase [Acidobacteriaceae bacterium]|jgi:riboflavin synthase
MFTGLIEATGEVVGLARGEGVARLTIAERPGAGIVARLRLGDSVAVSGVCLTALEIEVEAFPPRFSADLLAETIARTTLSRLEAGSLVNLELPTPAGAPLGGHVVQGHVDGVGTLVALEEVRPGAVDTDWVLRVRLPERLRRYVAEKGSIAVEGVSLTVAGVEEDEAWIAILPHTYRATNLHALRVGTGVNIEVDVLAKYAESRERPEGRELTVEYLLANGY